jgi:YggT family protein
LESGTSGVVNVFWQLVFLVLWLLRTLLLARLIVDMVRVFARSWLPTGRSAIAVESVYMVTDPPVRALRKVIPMVRIGGVALDLSLLILLLLLGWVLMPIVETLAIRSL